MAYTIKMTTNQDTCALLMSATCKTLGYKISAEKFRQVLQLPGNFSRCSAIGQSLRDQGSKKHGRESMPISMMGADLERVWMILPWKKGKHLTLHVLWKRDVYTFFVSAEDKDFRWEIHFARILYSLAGDFRKLKSKVTINTNELKIGEWLAALLFDLSGDRAGMLATLDEAQDRQ